MFNAENWGIKALQFVLHDLGLLGAAPTGVNGPLTHQAIKDFQGKNGLKASGEADPATRKALFEAYMKVKHDIEVDANRFRKVAGNPWMGCGANNAVKTGCANGENRQRKMNNPTALSRPPVDPSTPT